MLGVIGVRSLILNFNKGYAVTSVVAQTAGTLIAENSNP